MRNQWKISLPLVFSLLIFFLLYFIIVSHKINLVTADLGRHIINGQYVFIDKSVLSQNFYSYTYPTFNTINHHWAVGVLFYFIHKISGFVGLQIFNIFISFTTILIFLFTAKRKRNLTLLIPLAFIILPLLAQRTEIRPEILSNLFAGIIFSILYFFRERKINFRFLFLIPIIEVIWVNTHIYFFLGPVIIGSFLLESIIRKNKDSLVFLKLFIATSIATLLNPIGLTGSLAPFNEFKNYGYELAENKSVWFLEKYFGKSIYYVFKVVFAFLVFSFVLVLKYKPKKISITNLLLSIFISFMAWKMVRNITLFSLFSLPFITHNFETVKKVFPGKINLFMDGKRLKTKFSNINRHLFLLIFSIIILIYYFSTNQFIKFPYWREFGFGLETGNNASADFYITNNLHGPIYNNYDDGGYLIFHLFPKEKVFVDNRPEAYPASFFKNEYIPSQDDEQKWFELDKQYNFNTIFFSYNDLTPWGQKYIKNRINDPLWALVFMDKDLVVLLKKNQDNQSIINRFQINISP